MVICSLSSFESRLATQRLGLEYEDTMTIGGLSIQQSFGSAILASGFNGVDGILGYTSLARSRLHGI